MSNTVGLLFLFLNLCSLSLSSLSLSLSLSFSLSLSLSSDAIAPRSLGGDTFAPHQRISRFTRSKAIHSLPSAMHSLRPAIPLTRSSAMHLLPPAIQSLSLVPRKLCESSVCSTAQASCTLLPHDHVAGHRYDASVSETGCCCHGSYVDLRRADRIVGLARPLGGCWFT